MAELKIAHTNVRLIILTVGQSAGAHSKSFFAPLQVPVTRLKAVGDPLLNTNCDKGNRKQPVCGVVTV